VKIPLPSGKHGSRGLVAVKGDNFVFTQQMNAAPKGKCLLPEKPLLKQDFATSHQ